MLAGLLEAARRRAEGYALDHAGLGELLKTVHKPAVPGSKKSWWTAFMEWLRGRFPKMERSPQLDRLAAWLDGLLPSAQTVKFLFYGLLVTVLLAALAILLLEIRAAGLAAYIGNFFRARSRRSRRESPQQIRAEPGMDEIRGLPLSARTPALLKLCISLLVRRRFIESDKGLTNRELLQRLHAGHPELSKSFERLVDCAEYYVYGEHAPTDEGVGESFIHAERVLQAAVV
ncbi:MAG TPA: DUF4129 domain-containing protein [Gammaproteobacteria bacterium]|nr:DUF4129 domain-containing protein [Gammaproteobacteria bacterium]